MADNVIANPGSGGATFRTFAEVVTGTEWSAGVVAYVSGGTTGAWTLQQVDATHGLPVSVIGTVPVSGTFWQATQPVSLASVPSHAVTNAGVFAVQAAQSGVWGVSAVQSGTWNIGTLGTITNTVAVSIEGATLQVPIDLMAVGGASFALGQQQMVGSIPVTIASDQSGFPVSANQSGSWSVQAVQSGSWAVNQQPATSGGWVAGSYLAAASANQDSTVIKASAGQLGWFYVTNTNASPRYLKIYNKSTGPTSGDTPILRILIPGNSTGAGGTASINIGLAFASGISFRLTTGVADNDTGTVAANEIILNYGYK